MAYAADRVRARPGTEKLTYAYGRWEVLVALINAVALIAVSAVIVYAAVGRLIHPSAVNGPLVMAFALVSLVGNAVAAWLLEGEQSVNARSAFLHLIGDAAASGAVLVGGLFIWLAHLNRVDPVLSIAIAVWISYGAIKVIIEAGRILLEGVPVGLDVDEVERAVLGVDGVAGVHDLHVWSVSSTTRCSRRTCSSPTRSSRGPRPSSTGSRRLWRRPSASITPRWSSSAPARNAPTAAASTRPQPPPNSPPEEEEPPCHGLPA